MKRGFKDGSFLIMSTLRKLQHRSWSWFLKYAIFPLGDLAMRQKMMQRLSYLEKVQNWSPERIQRTRNQAFTHLMQIVYQEVPLYREAMDQAHLKPNQIRVPEDLRRLPVFTKDIYIQNYPERVTRSTGFKTYEARTSGSTGKNFCVSEDAETAGRYRACFLLALEWAGWRFGEPQVQMGMTTTRSFDRKLKDFLLNCHYVSAFDLSDQNLDATLDLIEKHRIQHLWGYPGSLYLLGRRANDKGWNQPLRTLVTWGDTLYPQYRATMEAAFCARVYDTYGCAEGIQVSAQCEYGNYHVHDLDTIVEFLGEDGFPVAPGESGHIILTRLHPGPMPLIRYKVGDLGAGQIQQQCDCGRGFSLMKSVQGRDTDIVVTPSGNRLIVHFFTGILEFFSEIDTFQVVQECLDSIIVRVVPADGFDDLTANRIVARLKEKGAADLKICVEPVTEIPLPPSGKRRFVVSKVAWESLAV